MNKTRRFLANIRLQWIFPRAKAFCLDILKCYGPFLFLLAVFSSFRILVPDLLKHVHYTIMPSFDNMVFGQLPTITLQHWLWHGYVTWYDYLFYIVYVSHYIFPVILAWVIYKKFRTEYVRFAATYLFATLTAFTFFISYPTAPPWLASQDGYIPHIVRISNEIFSSIGVHNFGQIYSNYAPNPVAALPSLHTAYSILFVLFAFRVLGKRWGAISLAYPFCIIVGVIYMGEHYAFDVVAGALWAVASYLLVPVMLRYASQYAQKYVPKMSFLGAFSGDNE